MKLFPICAILLVLNFKKENDSPKVEFRQGSVIVAVFTEDTIWMAADTKEFMTNTNMEKLGTRKHTKLYVNGNIYYGFTGISSIGTTTFDDIVKDISKKEKNFTKIFNRTTDSIRKEGDLFFYTQVQNRNYPFIDRLLDKGAVFDITMATFEYKRPHVMAKTYQLKTISQHHIGLVVVDSQNYIGGTPIHIVTTGHAKYINEFLAHNNNYFEKFKTVKNKLVCLINLQCEKDTSGVAMPADVLTIYNKGHKWSRGNKTCRTPL